MSYTAQTILRCYQEFVEWLEECISSKRPSFYRPLLARDVFDWLRNFVLAMDKYLSPVTGRDWVNPRAVDSNCLELQFCFTRTLGGSSQALDMPQVERAIVIAQGKAMRGEVQEQVRGTNVAGVEKTASTQGKRRPGGLHRWGTTVHADELER